jgi:hypothetical protein
MYGYQYTHVCEHIYISIYIKKYIYTQIHIYIYTQMHKNNQIYIFIYRANQDATWEKINQFLRLLRVLRLFNAIHFIDHVAVTSKLIKETFIKSGFVLTVFLFFALIIVVLLSGLIFVIEV